jgi:toxin ParE1/3/4
MTVPKTRSPSSTGWSVPRKSLPMPERGRCVPEWKHLGVLAYREIIVRPWRIIYRFDAELVYVLGLLGGRRDLASLLLERLTR